MGISRYRIRGPGVDSRILLHFTGGRMQSTLFYQKRRNTIRMKTKLGQFLFYCSAGILLIWLVTFFSSCISEKKRQEICRTCALKIETKTRDSIGEPTVKKSKYDYLVNVAN